MGGEVLGWPFWRKQRDFEREKKHLREGGKKGRDWFCFRKKRKGCQELSLV